MILAALAAGAGIARGVSGILSAGKQGRASRDLIKRAYQISKRRLNEDQGYTRQNMNESLNARGVLNGGADPGRSQTVADAYSAGDAAPAAKAQLGSVKNVSEAITGLKAVKAARPGSDEARMAADSEVGQSGEGGTISGQSNSDLSREFYGEHQDLFNERQGAILDTKREQRAATVGAIGAGIDVGTQVYQAGKMIQGALGAGVQPATGANGAGSPGVDVRFPQGSSGKSVGNWFGGYDPVDPLGLTKRKLTNDEFHVERKG